MLRSTCVLTVLSLVTTGCAGLGTSGDRSDSTRAAAPAKDDSSAAEAAWKIQELEQKAALAKSRVEIAHVEAESSRVAQEVRVDQAKTALHLAQRELAKFVESDFPARLANGELSLQTARDRAQEAIDELAQIELMYAEQDLNDKTAEFVVSRGRRSAERSAARIKIQEAEFKTLKESELPIERARLEMTARAKEAALAEAERDAKIGALNSEVALREAENALKRAEHELTQAREDQ